MRQSTSAALKSLPCTLHRCNPGLQPVCKAASSNHTSSSVTSLKQRHELKSSAKKSKQGLKARARVAREGGGGGGRRRLPPPSSAVELLLMRILLRRPNRGRHWFYWKHDTTMTLNDGNGINEPVGTTGSEKIVIIIIE